MFRTIVRTYRNAGAQVAVSLLIEETAARPPSTCAVFNGTGLAAHELASKGRRELLRQAKASKLPRGQRFEDLEWPVAAYAIRAALPQIRRHGAEHTGLVVPYMCLLAEKLSLDWTDGETRNVYINLNRSVWVHGIADRRSYHVLLQEDRAPVFSPPVKSDYAGSARTN